tara:strand:- start:275 stop:460 length:186 start_codon:yes stop_codon:yes gene_type:complete
MTEELIKRINDWNKIKYPNDKETRIIITTLKPNGYTWKQEADDMIEEYNTRGVTTAPNNKE